MDFSVKNLWVLHIGGVEVWITETIVNTWIIMLLLILLAVVVRIKLRRFTEIPTGFQNVVEAIVEAFDNLVAEAVGERFMFLGNWYFMAFSFLLISNLSGIVGMRPPTTDWATAFAFAFATFLLIHIMGAVYRKGAYFKSFFSPNPIFFPLNLIGELARPISLSFRLYGNILAGTILMTLFYNLTPLWLQFVLPAALSAYFDLFAGALQTYIFCVLSLTFIGSMASESA